MKTRTLGLMGVSTLALMISGLPQASIAAAAAPTEDSGDTIIITGAFCLLGSLWFTLQMPKVRTAMRPIYQEMGLLPG